MKSTKILTAFVVAAAIAPVMGSCSKDDAPDRPNSSQVSDMDGTRVTSVGNTQIRYDEKGRAYRFRDSYGYEIEIDYSKNKITASYNGEYDPEQQMDVKFNGKGFITEMSSSWSEKDDEYEYKGSGKITFSYDKNDCLTSIKTKMSETEKDLSDKSTSHYSEESTQKFNWSKGNIVSINYDETEVEDGDKDTYRTDMEIQYSFDENKFRQFPMSLLYESDGDYDVFFAVGLMGNGPADLPEQMTINEDGEGTRTLSINFDLNDNGSINTEYFGNYTSYAYGYTDITRSVAAGGKTFRLSPRALFMGMKKH